MLPLFILMFATAYFLMGRADPANFSEALTRSEPSTSPSPSSRPSGSAMCPRRAETTRLVVTGQMILDLIFLGVGIRTILGAVQKSKERSASDAT